MYKNWITGKEITILQYVKKNWFLKLFYYLVKFPIVKPTGSSSIITGRSMGIELGFVSPYGNRVTEDKGSRMIKSTPMGLGPKKSYREEEKRKKIEDTPYFGSSNDTYLPIVPLIVDNPTPTYDTDHHSFSGFSGGESGGGGASGSWGSDTSSYDSSSYDSSSSDSGSSFDSSSSD